MFSFIVPEGDALSVKIDKVLTFDFLELDGVAIAMSNIDVNFGEGAKVTDAQFGLVADKIEDFKLNDKEVQRFKAAGFAATGNLDPGNGVNLNGGTGVQFKVHVDGLSYALNGVGTLMLIRLQAPIKLGWRSSFPALVRITRII